MAEKGNLINQNSSIFIKELSGCIPSRDDRVLFLFLIRFEISNSYVALKSSFRNSATSKMHFDAYSKSLPPKNVIFQASFFLQIVTFRLEIKFSTRLGYS